MGPFSSYVTSRRGFRWLPACLVTGLIAASGAGAVEPPADLVFVDGAVYTVDAARSWASAVAVRGDRIAFVGDDAGARALVGPATRVVDLDGRMLLPGFQDSHVHPVWGGVERNSCDLNDSESAEEVLEKIRAYAAAHPDRPWITGGGWDLPLFPGANPDKRLLDAIVPDRPVFLDAADGHSAWVNSKALALAGVTAQTPDPPNGRIERDPESREPTGTLRESAKQLVSRFVPDPSAEELVAGLAVAVELAHRAGITGLLEASAGAEEATAYRELDLAGRLNLHVTLALTVDKERGVEQVAELVAVRDRDWGAEIRATVAKIFADGVLEAQTGALLEPYVGPAGARGDLNFSEPLLKELAVVLDRAGFQLHVHAIGDRAIRATFDAIEAAVAANGPRDRRPTLAHIELFAPADIPRFRKLGAVASFQPLWAWEDDYIEELTVPFLGPERSRWLYPIASVARTGAVLAGGSDWSVSSIEPLEAMEVAVTRRDPDAGPGEAWLPEERVDLATMIAAYTIGSAWASFRERDTGSIEPGKLADLVVLDRNLFDLAPHEISDAQVALTLFRGREVWRDPGFPAPTAPAR